MLLFSACSLIVFSLAFPTLYIKILHWTEIQSFALFFSHCCIVFLFFHTSHGNEYKRSPPQLIVSLCILCFFLLLIFLIRYSYPMLMIVKYNGERIIRLNNSGRLLSCSFKWSQNKHSTDRVWFIYASYTAIYEMLYIGRLTHSQSEEKKNWMRKVACAMHYICIYMFKRIQYVNTTCVL